MTDNLKRIADILTDAHEIAVYCHTNPDGDTISCALALYDALTRSGKTVCVICDGEIPAKYRFMKGAEKFVLPTKGAHELAFAVDCSDIDRLGGAAKSYLSAKKRIAVDHHKSHIRFAEYYHVDASAAACAEIICDLLESMSLLSDADTAALLFAGIVSDTGCFQYPSTSVKTHETACRLMRLGIDAPAIIYNVHRRITENVFRLKTRVLSACKFADGGKIAFLKFGADDFFATETSPSDTEGIVSSAVDVDGVEVAFAVSEVRDKNFKVSIRTKNYVDASDLAATFGGGGHVRAAGCRMNGFYEDVADKLLKAARDRL